MPPKAFICGLSGTELTPDEFDFLRGMKPGGIILFARNCQTQRQVRALTSAIFDALEDQNALILIDQEGGRVQRMAPPEWKKFPSAAQFTKFYKNDPDRGESTLRTCYGWLAQGLRKHGINVNCAPVLDVPQEEAHPIIGDRAYGNNPGDVIRLGRLVAEAHLENGVVPIMKHIPGHGRALVDSHEELPDVSSSPDELENWDFVPFRAMSNLPAAMTSHVRYICYDRTQPGSSSVELIHQVIRSQIGFDGLLISDDIGMKALKGTPSERMMSVLSAGCDMGLHCNGDLQEMRSIADAVPSLEGAALSRYRAIQKIIRTSNEKTEIIQGDTIHRLLDEVFSLTD
ncbi:MAG: beta-N-acetylhexosaminidase [Methyloligellaceae bacterium]